MLERIDLSSDTMDDASLSFVRNPVSCERAVAASTVKRSSSRLMSAGRMPRCYAGPARLVKLERTYSDATHEDPGGCP